MRILAIETSCDETSAAVVMHGTTVLANVIASAIEDVRPFGGVFPEVAARRQVECIIPVMQQTLREANMQPWELDAIAVTHGPGLLTSLLIGTMAARVCAWSWHKPLIGIHHTFGHLASPWLECTEEMRFPVLTLSVSGGHTDLWLRESHTRGTLLGSTLDDAAGEAFDKGATLLGLPYPGGPALAHLAQGGHARAIAFPQPLAGKETGNFSFAGLKTALKYALRDRGGIEACTEAEKRDYAASYQEAINAHLTSRVVRAFSMHAEVQEVHVVGGVSANIRLRTLLTALLPNAQLRWPLRSSFCTDNAAMIAAAAEFFHRERGKRAFLPFVTAASLPLKFPV